MLLNTTSVLVLPLRWIFGAAVEEIFPVNDETFVADDDLMVVAGGAGEVDGAGISETSGRRNQVGRRVAAENKVVIRGPAGVIEPKALLIV